MRCSLNPKTQAVNKSQRQLRPEPYFPIFFKSRAQNLLISILNTNFDLYFQDGLRCFCYYFVHQLFFPSFFLETLYCIIFRYIEIARGHFHYNLWEWVNPDISLWLDILILASDRWNQTNKRGGSCLAFTLTLFVIVIFLNCSQGCKARKVISEVYTSLVLQCTVSGR